MWSIYPGSTGSQALRRGPTYESLNPIRAELFGRNIHWYLHVTSFTHIEMTQVDNLCSRMKGPSYMVSREYRVVWNRCSRLLFTSEDRLCANFVRARKIDEYDVKMLAPRVRAVTDQLWWHHNATLEKTVLDNNGWAQICRRQNICFYGSSIHRALRRTIPKWLQSYYLKVNADKTEHFIAPYQSKSNKQTTRSNLEWSELDWVLNQPIQRETNSTSTIPDCKKWKLLGSMLDTETDIRARKNKTIDIMNLYKHFF